MSTAINTNVSSLQAQNSLRSTNLNMSTAMERLSSGVRINSARDDAAGLAISTRMTANIRGIAAAVRNANDGISLTQTAEGSLGQISDNLQRIRELAVQSSNAGNNASDRAAMNNEAKQLIAEIDRVASNTGFNGIKLLDGSFQNQALQIGTGNDANDRISVSIASAKSSALGVGSNSSFLSTTNGVAVGATALASSGLNINGFATAAAQADGVSATASSTSGIAVATAINAISANTNVTATVGQTSLAGTTVTGFSTAIAANDVKINGVSIGAIAAASSAGGRGGQVAAAINAITAQTGVTATFSSTTGAVALNAADGRNVTVTAENAGGSLAATGLGRGTVQNLAGATLTDTGAIAAGTVSVNGVSVGAIAAGSAVTAVTGVTETAEITVSATVMTAGQTLTIGGLTYTTTAASTQAEVEAAFQNLAAGATTGGGTAKGTYSGVLTGFSTGAAVNNKIIATSTTANTPVDNLAAATGSGSAAITSIVATQGVTAVTAVTAIASKGDNVAAAINLLTSQTGVTATNVAGAVSLASDGRAIALADNAATKTGIGATLTSGTASNATTSRSLVSLSSINSNGINISGSTAAALTAAGLSEGSATVTTSAGAGVSSLDLTTASGSQAALTTLDAAINTITDSRASMGAFQNRLTASISNLETTSLNLQASRGRILDTDYAKETTTLAKSQIISQAATAMLAQANQSGQSVLALLK